jgi:hypothetical protein
MIRRILRADVRAIASEAKREIVNAYHRNFCLLFGHDYATLEIGRRRGRVELRGLGYVLDSPHADNWPEGAAILHIGRVTLAAWGGRSS